MFPTYRTVQTVLLCTVLFISGCGGGGGGGGSGSSTSGASSSGSSGSSSVTSNSLAQICAAGSPYAADATSPTRVGAYRDEQKWVNAYLSERYLWYRDMPSNVLATDPAYNVYTADGTSLYYGTSLTAYFRALLNPNTSASGKKVDAFSFLTSTSYWNSFVNSQDLGYGFSISAGSGANASNLYIVYVYPGSNGERNGFLRGDQIISIDGVAATDTNVQHQAAFNAALYPSKAQTHTFVLNRNGATVTKLATSALETLKQVESQVLSNGSKKVGYLVLNSHVPSAEPDLVAAANTFKQNNIDELVLDMRYNGGGYISVASAVSYAIAGSTATNGKTFETLTYNDKRTRDNVVVPFYNTTGTGTTLPGLNMPRVYVLTSANTCSASEAVVNGLRGVGVEVQLVGATSCGKPYGYSAQDNCGVTFAAMEFVGYNGNGVSVSPDGLVPNCNVADDLAHPLGDSHESMLSVALHLQLGETCSQAKASSALASTSLRGLAMPQGGKLVRPEWRANQFIESGAQRRGG